jgi:hypothetical protein
VVNRVEVDFAVDSWGERVDDAAVAPGEPERWTTDVNADLSLVFRDNVNESGDEERDIETGDDAGSGDKQRDSGSEDETGLEVRFEGEVLSLFLSVTENECVEGDRERLVRPSIAS